MSVLSVRCIASIGIIAFLLSFALETGRQWRGQVKPACEYNLKALWLLSRHASIRFQYPFPPPYKFIRHIADSRQPVLLTRQTAEYLKMPQLAGVYANFDSILLCARDPDYLLKMAKMSQNLDYEPSYLWHPDAKTLAYCPYCKLAVLLDGRLEKR